MQPDDAKKYILAAAAASGGVALAAAVISAQKQGWMEEGVSDEQTAGEVYGTVAAIATGLFLGERCSVRPSTSSGSGRLRWRR